MKHISAVTYEKDTDGARGKDSYLDELAGIKAELSSLNRAVSRVLEHTGNQQMNMMFSEIKSDLSKQMIKYMMHDTRDTLDSNMPEDCNNKQMCKSLFENLLQEMSLLLLEREVDEKKLKQCQERFDKLKELSPTENCDSCMTHASGMFKKQMELLRTVSSSVNMKPENENTTSIVELPEEVVGSICEPLANRQRLLILKKLSVETRSFSELSKITGLRGGNLLFHLQKLLDTGMILQRTERGDYLLTNKGYRILRGIADLYDTTEKVPAGNILLESDQLIS